MSKTQETHNPKRVKRTTIVYLCFLTLLITLSIFNLSFYVYSKPEISYLYKNDMEKRIIFWKSFLDSHPSYFEGWIELSRLEFKNGNQKGAQVAFLKAWKVA